MAAIILRAGCRLGLAGRREAAGGAPDLTLTRAPLQQAVRMNFDARMAARWFGRLNRRRESRVASQAQQKALQASLSVAAVLA